MKDWKNKTRRFLYRTASYSVIHLLISAGMGLVYADHVWPYEPRLRTTLNILGSPLLTLHEALDSSASLLPFVLFLNSLLWGSCIALILLLIERKRKPANKAMEGTSQ